LPLIFNRVPSFNPQTLKTIAQLAGFASLRSFIELSNKGVALHSLLHLAAGQESAPPNYIPPANHLCSRQHTAFHILIAIEPELVSFSSIPQSDSLDLHLASAFARSILHLPHIAKIKTY